MQLQMFRSSATAAERGNTRIPFFKTQIHQGQPRRLLRLICG
jgi:hypothetical protein